MRKKEILFNMNDPPEISPRKSSRSPTNPAIKKNFAGVRKNVKGMKHLTVLIPEDCLNSPKKKKIDKAYWETVWESLVCHFEENQSKKGRRIRSQSFDEYICQSNKFIHHGNFIYILRKMKERVAFYLSIFIINKIPFWTLLDSTRSYSIIRDDPCE